LIPLIVYVCAIGAYAVNNSATDIWYLMIFGVVGYVFKKLDYPLAPLVLAPVLGDMAESALRQSLIMSQGSPLIFVASPISAALVAVSLWLLLPPSCIHCFNCFNGCGGVKQRHSRNPPRSDWTLAHGLGQPKTLPMPRERQPVDERS
jgi:TctA family transporter